MSHKFMTALLWLTGVVCTSPPGLAQTNPSNMYFQALHLIGSNQIDAGLAGLCTIDSGELAYRAIDRIFEIRQVQDQITLAENYFQELTRNPVTASLGWYGLAKLAFEQKDFATATGIIEKLIESSVVNEPVMNTLRRCHDHRQSAAEMHAFFTRKLPEDSTNAFYWYGLAHAEYGLKHFQTALMLYDRVLRLDSTIYRAHLWKQHVIYNTSGNFKTGIQLGQKLIRNENIRKDLELYPLCLNLLGHFYHAIGYFPKAIDCFQEAYARSKKLGLFVNQCGLLGNLIQVCATTGDPRALEYFPEAIKLARQTRHPDEVFRHTLNLGLFYATIGDLANARAFFRNSLKFAAENQVSHPGYLSNTFRYLAEVLAKTGEFAAATDSIQHAIALATARENPELIAECQMTAGVIYQKSGQFAPAIEALQAAEKFFRESQDHFHACECGVYLAEIRREMNQIPVALAAFHEAEQIAARLNYPQLAWKARIGLAGIQEKQGNHAAAIAGYQLVIDEFEAFGTRFLSESSRFDFLENQMQTYERLIQLLLISKTSKTPQQDGAFEMLERMKSAALRDTFDREQLIQRLEAVSEELKIEYLTNQQLCESKQQEFARLAATASGDDIQINILKSEILQLQNQQSELIREVCNFAPELSFSHQPVVTLAEIQQKGLRPNQILIEYFVSDQLTAVWIAAPDRLEYVKLPLNRGLLRDKIKAISATLFAPAGRNSSPEKLLVTHAVANIRSEALLDLYQALFQPIENNLHPGAELILVADDWLSYLPFEMLVTRFDGSTPHYLLEKYPITYAFSAQSYFTGQPPKHKPEKELLALANPLLGIKTESGVLDYLKTSFAALFRENKLLPLPFSEQEVQSIAQAVRNSEIRVGTQATENYFKNQAGEYRIIHLATHHVLNERHPELSQLILAQGIDDDGFLNLYEIMNTRLNADLVVLSACNSARGQYRRSTGIFSMCYAFKCAGAANVLASLWWVEDASTAWLMQRFYQHLQTGASKARALQLAKMDLLKEGAKTVYPAARNPFYWAPFILVGSELRF